MKDQSEQSPLEGVPHVAIAMQERYRGSRQVLQALVLPQSVLEEVLPIEVYDSRAELAKTTSMFFFGERKTDVY